MNNVINGVNLQKAANIVIDQDRKDSLNNLPEKSIIWCKTDYLEYVFNILHNKNGNFTLITHCSDRAITEKIFLYKPPCIRVWFAQNVDYKHPNLIPLPIGIENHFSLNRGSYTDFNYFTKNAFDFSIKNKIINKLYCNYRNTHSDRLVITNTIQKNNIGYFDNIGSYKDYTNNIKKYLFVASPRGNGIDSHRTWEALYYGCIPVVTKHIMYDTYKKLPIIQVEDWNNINIDFLKNYANLYKNNILFANMYELTLEYWINKIQITTQ